MDHLASSKTVLWVVGTVVFPVMQWGVIVVKWVSG